MYRHTLAQTHFVTQKHCQTGSHPPYAPPAVARLEKVEGKVDRHHKQRHDRVGCNLTRRRVRQLGSEPDAAVDDGQGDDDASRPDVHVRPAAALLGALELGMVQLAEGALNEQHANEDDAKVLMEMGKMLFFFKELLASCYTGC